MEQWTEHHASCRASNDCEGWWSAGCNCPRFWPRPAAYHQGEFVIGRKAVAALTKRVQAQHGEKQAR